MRSVNLSYYENNIVYTYSVSIRNITELLSIMCIWKDLLLSELKYHSVIKNHSFGKKMKDY